MSIPSIVDVLERLAPWRGAPAVYVVLLTAVLIALFWDWRLALVALVAQYVAAGLLFLDVLDPQLAFVKLLTGLFVSLILAITGWQVRYGKAPRGLTPAQAAQFRNEPYVSLGAVKLPRNAALRLVGTIVAVFFLLLWVQRPSAALPGLPEGLDAVTAAIWILLVLGLLGLVLSRHPLPAGMSFFTFMTGIELYYSGLAHSVLSIAVLAAINLLVAVAVSYLSQTRRALAYAVVTKP